MPLRTEEIIDDERAIAHEWSARAGGAMVRGNYQAAAACFRRAADWHPYQVQSEGYEQAAVEADKMVRRDTLFYEGPALSVIGIDNPHGTGWRETKRGEVEAFRPAYDRDGEADGLGAVRESWDYVHAFTYWRSYSSNEGGRCDYFWNADRQAWELGVN